MSDSSIQHQAEGARDAFVTMLVVHFLMGFIGFVTSTMAARLLGPAGRGELTAVQQIPVLVGILAGLGMGEAALFFTAKQPRA
ncbi:MAG: hypothetical protein QF637_12995, partial [Acidimicrobiales bacterium]|nr:hypothetical protein [Acidimicrobiales bacterium]